MNLYQLAWREFHHRRAQLFSGLLTVSLGIAVIVAIRSVAEASERAVKVRLDNLGANTLVLPAEGSVGDYYAADIDAPTMPQEYVERIVTSAVPGVESMSPKLTRRVDVGGRSIVLTGILPTKDLPAAPAWAGGGLLGQEPAHVCDPDDPRNRSHGLEDERLQRKAIDELGRDECLVGAEAAERLGWSRQQAVSIQGREFRVARVLPSTGTVDDDRVFVHLEAAQALLGIPARISSIEIHGCCKAIGDGMLAKLRNVLPDTRVTTIHHIVSTQVETNRQMNRASLAFLVIVLFVGAMSIGNFMWANVNQRRREIGILVMIGTPRRGLYRMILAKAVGVGLLGGGVGYALGTTGGVVAGPWFADLAVRPMPAFLPWSLLLATVTALLGAAVPAWLAARMEPFSNMQET